MHKYVNGHSNFGFIYLCLGLKQHRRQEASQSQRVEGLQGPIWQENSIIIYLSVKDLIEHLMKYTMRVRIPKSTKWHSKNSPQTIKNSHLASRLYKSDGNFTSPNKESNFSQVQSTVIYNIC